MYDVPVTFFIISSIVIFIKGTRSGNNRNNYIRLSFDYYLYKAGFKNLKVHQAIPQNGEFFINEVVPGDYDVHTMLMKHTGPAVPVDTIRIHSFPVKTSGAGGGFYGNDRLPYAFSIKHSQKEYVVYKVKEK